MRIASIGAVLCGPAFVSACQLILPFQETPGDGGSLADAVAADAATEGSSLQDVAADAMPDADATFAKDAADAASDAVAEACSPDLTTDPKNCGSCGHDCLGGLCSGSMCQPIALTDPDQMQLEHMRLGNGAVFWTNACYAAGTTGLWTVPVDGGPAAATMLTADTYMSDLAVDPGRVFWGSAASVRALDLDGSDPYDFVADAAPIAVTDDDASVYWSDWKLRAILGQLKGVTSAQGTPLYAGLLGTPQEMVAFGGTLYWTQITDSANPGQTSDGLYAASLSATTANQLTQSEKNPSGIAVDATGVYWADNGGVGMPNGSVQMEPLGVDGGTVTTFAPDQNHPAGVYVDATDVYWTNSGTPPMFFDGTVMRAPKTDLTQATTIAKGQTHPLTIRGDALFVYWADWGTPANANPGQCTGTTGQVWKLAK
jgi:hypothetical protein